MPQVTLVLSPDQFDFAQNVVVRVNGRVAIDRPRRQEPRDAAQVGGKGQRPYDAVRRRNHDQPLTDHCRSAAMGSTRVARRAGM